MACPGHRQTSTIGFPSSPCLIMIAFLAFVNFDAFITLRCFSNQGNRAGKLQPDFGGIWQKHINKVDRNQGYGLSIEYNDLYYVGESTTDFWKEFK